MLKRDTRSRAAREIRHKKLSRIRNRRIGDGVEVLEITARQQLTIRCGESSITLTAGGKIILRGKYIVSRSSGVQRIKGGSVQIN
jgi:hypothetical protein